MKNFKRLLSLTLSVFMILSAMQLSVYASPQKDDADAAPYMIQFSSKNSADKFAGLEGFDEICADGDDSEPVLVTAELTENEVLRLASSAEVIRVEKDYTVSANSVASSDCQPVETTWNLKAVGIEEVPDAETGDGVSVAVLDSGIDIYSDISVYGGVDFVDPIYSRGDDMTGHGTAVAGIIAASGSEMTGIAPGAEINNVRVLDESNKSPVSRIIAGIDWCIENEIDIINMSFGTVNYSSLLEDKIKEATEAGILLISSAGNGGVIQYPAKFSEVIAVGSVSSSMTRSEGSAVGAELEIVAPGENIYSASLLGGFGTVSGTSIAASHITGIAAALLSKDTSKSPDFIKALLDTSSKSLGDPRSFGSGIADIGHALQIYDEFALNYNSISYTAPQNTEKVTTYESDDIYVDGQWSSNGHNGIIDSCVSIDYPAAIKNVSLVADNAKYLEGSSYQKCLLFHATDNYIVTAKLLYEIAAQYKNYGLAFNHASYRSDLSSLLGYGVNSYSSMMNNITQMLNYYNTSSTSMFYNGEHIASFSSVSEKTSAIVYGLFIHLLGDIYSHRLTVPTTCLDNETATSHSKSGGNNQGLYFVAGDFTADCCKHIFSPTELIESEYNARRESLVSSLFSSNSILSFFGTLIDLIIWMINGKTELIEKYSGSNPEEQAALDESLLSLAKNVPSSSSGNILCGNGPSCYGAMKRIAGLGVLQFKDIKYFLNGYGTTASSTVTANQLYYEDQSPDNAFYYRRFIAAKNTVQQYVSCFSSNATFSPYYLLTCSKYTDSSIKSYCMKLDQYYNYLKAYDDICPIGQKSNILNKNFWDAMGDSLFNYTTIIYNNNYFIDPATYPNGQKPKYYNSVFPLGTGIESADYFYIR